MSLSNSFKNMPARLHSVPLLFDAVRLSPNRTCGKLIDSVISVTNSLYRLLRNTKKCV